ncbi:MAG: tartronate semialdehyde reductase [Candidatus Poribacteria bacterium]|nr:MAG: tartronate semialdehyde reductase [Candidatus Poribacteria bacterium]
MALPKVGWIGLGIMGKPMVRNLLNAGYPLVVWNRSRPAVDLAASWGATPANSAKEVAEQCEIVVTMVPDSPDVQQVVLGPNGIYEGIRPGSVYVDMSTISPMVTKRIAAKLAEKGVQMLDAPVSGGDIGAQRGTLSIMVGGPREAFERCLPLFQILGENIVHAGEENGLGQFVKLCNQTACGLNLLAMVESIALGAKAGLDLEKMLAAITKGAAGSWMLSNLGPKVIAGDWEPGFMVKLQQKDLRLVLEAAASLGLPLPGTALVHQLFRVVEAAGLGEKGTQALAHALERMGNFKIHPDEG